MNDSLIDASFSHRDNINGAHISLEEAMEYNERYQLLSEEFIKTSTASIYAIKKYLTRFNIKNQKSIKRKSGPITKIKFDGTQFFNNFLSCLLDIETLEISKNPDKEDNENNQTDYGLLENNNNNNNNVNDKKNKNININKVEENKKEETVEEGLFKATEELKKLSLLQNTLELQLDSHKRYMEQTQKRLKQQECFKIVLQDKIQEVEDKYNKDLEKMSQLKEKLTDSILPQFLQNAGLLTFKTCPYDFSDFSNDFIFETQLESIHTHPVSIHSFKVYPDPHLWSIDFKETHSTSEQHKNGDYCLFKQNFGIALGINFKLSLNKIPNKIILVAYSKTKKEEPQQLEEQKKNIKNNNQNDEEFTTCISNSIPIQVDKAALENSIIVPEKYGGIPGYYKY
ncbi:expressed protein, partial [Dictyostelium purpureum]